MVKGLSKIQINVDKFFLKICLLILRILTSTWGKEPPIMTNRKELKKDTTLKEE